MNHILQKMGYQVDIPLALMTFLVTGDWVNRNSSEPGKLLVMMLDWVQKKSDSKEEVEARVRMTIQQCERDSLDGDTIKEMSKFEFCKTENIYELKHQLKNAEGFFTIVLGQNSVVVGQIRDLASNVEKNEDKIIDNFEKDPLFGIKFYYQVDCCLQLFFTSCSQEEELEDVNFKMLDLLHIKRAS